MIASSRSSAFSKPLHRPTSASTGSSLHSMFLTKAVWYVVALCMRLHAERTPTFYGASRFQLFILRINFKHLEPHAPSDKPGLNPEGILNCIKHPCVIEDFTVYLIWPVLNFYNCRVFLWCSVQYKSPVKRIVYSYSTYIFVDILCSSCRFHSISHHVPSLEHGVNFSDYKHSMF